jgi:uncharacterized membrane-anchored protein
MAIDTRTSNLVRVPAVTAFFWTIKALSTAMGESTSDFMVKRFGPVPAVLCGFVAFAIALGLQLRQGRYRPWAYWFAVVMVGVFGTMGADVMHVGLGVPYAGSVVLCTIVLTVVFVWWQRAEGTLSVHDIDSTRRELFYWAAVVSTFALGTALGDLTAITLHLGYLASAVLFGAIILVPAVGYRWLGWNATFSFWFAYVMTRPLGASVADWMGKPKADGGLGWGSGVVSAALSLVIIVLVAYVSVTGADSP